MRPLCSLLPTISRLALALALSFALSATSTSAQAPASGGESLAGGEIGKLHFVSKGDKVCTFGPFIANASWNFFNARAVPAPADAKTAPAPAPLPGTPFPFVIEVAGQPPVNGELRAAGKDGAVDAVWTFTATGPIAYEQLAVGASFDVNALAGGSWALDDGRTGKFPRTFETQGVFGGRAKWLQMTFPDGRAIQFNFPEGALVGMQDSRQWNNQEFNLRIAPAASSTQQERTLAKGDKRTISVNFSMAGSLTYSPELPEFLKPVTLAANAEWIPLVTDPEVEANSALDLSGFGFVDGPCGEKGRIIINKDGHFAYEKEPAKARRFYGVNFCFSSLYLPKDKVDKLLDRLVRLGYNTVRIHHYEGHLSKEPWKTGFDWDPVKVDQLDYFIAGCIKRGLWLTTDLFVSRPVAGKQVGLPSEKLEMNEYKLLLPVHQPALDDLKLFTRKFYDRVNPYTGRKHTEEPGIAWVSLINEGGANVYWNRARTMPQWKAAWNRWLGERFPTREELEIAIGDLESGEDPAKGTVELPSNRFNETRRGRLCTVFISDMERSVYVKLRDFLHKELKWKALLSNMNNSGPGMVPLQFTRSAFDYVDEHFYVDHPHFLEKEWRLPSSFPNSNPIASGAPGANGVASVRLFGKPFTVSEFNYSGPGRFRGVGGILTASMAALQDWDVVWRFAYSHSDKNLFEQAPIGYFDLVTDPLNQAADRLAVLLYLRRDISPAPGKLAAVIPKSLLRAPPKGVSVSALRNFSWVTQIGSVLVGETDQAGKGMVSLPVPLPKENEAAVIAEIRQKLGMPAATAPEAELIRSQTGEITLAPVDSVLTIDTPKSAGGYCEPGKFIHSVNAGVKIDYLTYGATVFVTSLDPQPIRTSKRLLVTHLTDLQNTEIKYGEGDRKTLYAWGKLPHLVREGSANIHIAVPEPATYTVYALTTGGKRMEKVETRVEDGQLAFTASVKGKDGNARMLYEVIRE